jgi:hypothetical protein
MSFIPSEPNRLIERWGLAALAGLSACLGLLGAQQTFAHWDGLSQQATASRVRLTTQRAQTLARIAEIEQQRAVIDALRDNHTTDFDELIIKDYVLSEQQPVLDWQTTVNPAHTTRIYDKHRQCIGFAYQGNFYFIQHYPKACER